MESILDAEFDNELKLLLEAIHVKYSYDFMGYDEASIKRRVFQAMNRMECRTVAAVQEKILQSSESFYDLLQYLTVPVSELFRDPSYFLAFRESVVPLLKTYPSLKIWVAGCSTGEEVYSLAIILEEEKLLDRTFLYATDINPRSLEKAEKGSFDLKEIQISNQNYIKSGGKFHLSNYYTEDLKTGKFNLLLKKNVTFANHNLVTDSVFSEMQFISCRNVLIYFDHKLQKRACGLFHESLCRKGFLGLGAKETLLFSEHAMYFDPFMKKDRIFQKK